MKKVLLSIGILLFNISILLAQTTPINLLKLKNGSIIKGKIIEVKPNHSVKIETNDGSIFIYKIDEVEEITQVESQKNNNDPVQIKSNKFPQWNNKNAVVFNPFQIIISSAISAPSITLEYQRIITPHLSWFITPELAFTSYYGIPIYGFGVTTGLYVMFFGHNLDGLFLRAGGTIGALTALGTSVLVYGGETLLGYQIVFENNLVLSFGLGIRFNNSGVSFAWEIAKIGIAF